MLVDGWSQCGSRCLEPCVLPALGPHWLGHLCSTQWAPGKQGQEDVRQKLTIGLHLLLFNYLQTISKLARVWGSGLCLLPLSRVGPWYAKVYALRKRHFGLQQQ